MDADEELVVCDTQGSKNVSIQKLKEFCCYFTTIIEGWLGVYSSILNKVNNDAAAVAGSLCEHGMLHATKLYFKNRRNERDANILREMVNFFDADKNRGRQILMEAAMDIFYCFEGQIVRLTCKKGPERAIRKFAKDAAHRVFAYFLKTKPGEEITKDDVCKGVMLGRSRRFFLKLGRQVKVNDENGKKWRTWKIFKKVGIFHGGECYGGGESDVYGYRRIFAHEYEGVSELLNKLSKIEGAVPNFNLEKDDFPSLQVIHEFIEQYLTTEEGKKEVKENHAEMREVIPEPNQPKEPNGGGGFFEQIINVVGNEVIDEVRGKIIDVVGNEIVEEAEDALD